MASPRSAVRVRTVVFVGSAGRLAGWLSWWRVPRIGLLRRDLPSFPLGAIPQVGKKDVRLWQA